MDNTGAYWTIWDYTGTYKTIGSIQDHTRPYETTRDHTWQYGTIRDCTGRALLYHMSWCSCFYANVKSTPGLALGPGI